MRLALIIDNFSSYVDTNDEKLLARWIGEVLEELRRAQVKWLATSGDHQ